jgi:molecular chaperone HtpG
MEKMLIEQKQLNKRFSKILELNTHHPIIKKLANYIQNDQNQAEILVNILFGEACILEGEVIDNPYELIRNINQML